MRKQLDGRRSLPSFIRDDASELYSMAKKEGLDLSATVTAVNPQELHVWQEVDQKVVDRIARVLQRAREWPQDMPLIVVGRRADGTREVVDGNHRRAAAIQAGLDTIPVVEVDLETLDFMAALGVVGVPLDTLMEAFAIDSSAMDQNQDLRWLTGELDS